MESDEKYRQSVHQNAAESNRLLNHPMIQGFIKAEVDDLFDQFCSLEPGATLQQYMELHLAAVAMIKLKESLQQYLTAKEELIYRDQRNAEVLNDDEER